MKNNILQKIISIGMALNICIGFIPSNLVYASSESIIVNEESNNEEASESITENEESNNEEASESITENEENNEEHSEGTISDQECNDTENTQTMIDNIINSIKISSNNVYNGNEVKVEVDINDSQKQNIEDIELYWEDETGEISKTASMDSYDYNEETGYFETNIYMPKYIDETIKMNIEKVRIWTWDDYFYLNREDLQNQGIKVENLDIKVEKWKPNINFIDEIKLSSNNVYNGNQVKVQVKINETQRKNISEVRLYWEDESADISEMAYMELADYNKKTGYFETNIYMPRDIDEPIKMNIKKVEVETEDNNYLNLNREDLQNQGIKVENLDINVEKWRPNVNFIDEIKLSSNNAYNGNQVKVQVKINDSQKQNIKYIELYWEDETGDISETAYIGSYDYNEEIGYFETDVYIPRYVDNSTKMKLKKIEIETEDNNYIDLNREDLKNQGVNVDNLDINVEKWIPVIKNINISSNKISKGEPIKVELDADIGNYNKEDITSIDVEWVDKNDNYNDMLASLKYNEKSGKFEGETSIYFSLDQSRDMVLNEIRVYTKGDSYPMVYLYREDLQEQGINLDKLNINISSLKPVMKSVDISNKKMTYPLDGKYTTNISVELESSDEIENIQCWYEDGYYKENYLLYNKSTGKYEGSYTFSEGQSGELSRILINYKNGSYIYIDREELNNIGTGKGYYITDGYSIPITWTKTSRNEQTVYKKLNGEEITVNDGNTFIQIAPKDSAKIS